MSLETFSGNAVALFYKRHTPRTSGMAAALLRDGAVDRRRPNDRRAGKPPQHLPGAQPDADVSGSTRARSLRARKQVGWLVTR